MREKKQKIQKRLLFFLSGTLKSNSGDNAYMDCKEFERLIPEFVDKKLDYAMTKRFVYHVKNCPNCKEELNIQFLVGEGLVRLEEGSAFDLQKEMQELIHDANRKVRFHERFLFWGKFFEGLVMVIVLVGVVAIIML